MDKCDRNSSGLFFFPLHISFLLIVFVDEPLVRLTEYLCQHCPLCFGRDNWFKSDEMCLIIVFVSFSLFLSVDAIVCVDACFTQKR